VTSTSPSLRSLAADYVVLPERAGSRFGSKNILVPTDFSEHAELALKVAVDLSRVHHAGLTLLHVHASTPFELPQGYLENMPSHLDRVYDELNQRLSEVERVVRSWRAQRLEKRVLHGSIVDEIVNFAVGFDYVVLGTQHRKGLDQLLVGSVAQRVLERAVCLVLVVRAAQAPT
jgi:nucleotide-binding universal stress UspA family protein